ncbi:MAG: Asp-tRNA(Asn)/Glu-tRNA(Gln) amidotransferase subunit GatC [Tissierellia bacterium]|nr:Asp-tRNA(Asn)/Glu-tRNA(Gln) amidotransferase subunit GatC [Tissierellia bacterium]
MNKIDVEKIDVDKIYQDSMLELPQDKREDMIRKFKDVVEGVNSIFEIDTEGVEYYEITTQNISPLREDVPAASLDRELALSNTKHREYGYFKLGKVVE